MLQIKKPRITIFNIPIIVIFVISVIAFIVATFYDQAIAQYFAQFFYNINVRYWLKVYDILGNFEPLIGVVIAAFVIIEAIFLHYKFSPRKNWLKKCQWLPFIIYGLFLAGFSYYVITDIINTKGADEGYGPGINVPFVLTWKPVLIIKIIVYVCIMALFITVICLLRFKFATNQKFLTQKYWADGVKIIIFIILIFLLVTVLKRGFGRPFYLCIHFNENNIGQMLTDIGGHRENLSGFKDFYYGEDGTIFYHEWYQPNNIAQNVTWSHWWMLTPITTEYMRGYGDGWNNGSFTSGHVTAWYSIFILLIFFFDRQRQRKIAWWKIALLVIMWSYLISLNFNLIMAQTHWLTDTTCSFILWTLILWLINFIINKKIVFKNK